MNWDFLIGMISGLSLYLIIDHISHFRLIKIKQQEMRSDLLSIIEKSKNISE